MGMNYKRGKVLWSKYYSGGKPIRESTGTAKQKEAERFLKDREGRMAMARRSYQGAEGPSRPIARRPQGAL